MFPLSDIPVFSLPADHTDCHSQLYECVVCMCNMTDDNPHLVRFHFVPNTCPRIRCHGVN